MLSLPIRSLGALFAIDDDAAPQRAAVALARPRLARDPDGAPRCRLVRWTAASGSDAVVGARLTLEAELQPTAEELAAAGLAEREVVAMPWLDARVRLDGPMFEPVEGQAALVPGAAAPVAIDLSPQAGALLAPLLQGGSLMPLQLTWTGHVWMRLPALEVVASADARELRRRVDIAGGNGNRAIVRGLLETQARIEVRGPADAELEPVLRAWALRRLAECFAAGDALSIRTAAADVVRWPLELSTSLDELVPAALRGALVQTVVLDTDELGRAPAIEARVLGDFAGVLERVDLRLETLDGTGGADLSFVEPGVQAARLGSTDFRWRWRRKLKEQAAGEWSAPVEQRGATSVLLPVTPVARRDIEVLAAGLDLARRWRSVRVQLRQQAPGPGAGAALELDAAHPGVVWTPPADALAGAEGITAELSFLSWQGAVVTREMPLEPGPLLVRDPMDQHRLRFVLVPEGNGWGEVALAMVDLRYVDGPYAVEEALELRRLEDCVEWEVPARPDGPRGVQWRLHVSFSDGRFVTGGWQSGEEALIAVRVDAAARREVQVLPVFFDAALTRSAELLLRSGDGSEQRLVVSDRSPRTVLLPPGPFTWTLGWTRADGTAVEAASPVLGEDVIVLPRFAAA